MRSPEIPIRRLKQASAAAAVFGIVALTSADCAVQPTTPSPENTLTVSRALTPESPKASWDVLSPIVRLKKLLYKDYPNFEGFDRQKEVTLATAQAYCQQTKCNIPAIDLANAVQFLNEGAYIAKRLEDNDHPLSPEEIEDWKKTKIGMTNLKREIYINQTSMDNFVNIVINKHPYVANKLEGMDVRTAFAISLLAHEFTHLNLIAVKRPPITIDVFSVSMPGMNSIKFDALEDFRFKGSDTLGTQKAITGGDEAITDLAALIIVGKKMKLPHITDPQLGRGVDLIDKLNKMAGVSDDEFLKYVRGEIPSTDLLKIYGASKIDPTAIDLNVGIKVFSLVGFAMHKAISFENAENEIRNTVKLGSK